MKFWAEVKEVDLQHLSLQPYSKGFLVASKYLSRRTPSAVVKALEKVLEKIDVV